MTMGDRVKALREQKGLTQEQLAEMLGYKSKSSIGHIENGRDIPRKQIIRLAEILGCTPQYLLGWEDAKSTPTINRSALIEEILSMTEAELQDLAQKMKNKPE